MNFDCIEIFIASISVHQGRVGFIGLGNMGGPMALNLLKKVLSCHAYT